MDTTTDKKTLTFGGYPCELRKVHGEVLIHCKNVIGTYDQIMAFIEKRFNPSGTYIFGVRAQDKSNISWSVVNPKNLKIACLEGTPEELILLKRECESLLLLT